MTRGISAISSGTGRWLRLAGSGGTAQRFRHFQSEVDGLGLHFVHERGTGPDAVPILLRHGWPGSFVQMLDLIPMLTHPASQTGEPAISFDVVATSLPGYGFSDRPTALGMRAARMAPLFQTLMTEVLGYERYAVRASDLGAGVASQLALLAPTSLYETMRDPRQ